MSASPTTPPHPSTSGGASAAAAAAPTFANRAVYFPNFPEALVNRVLEELPAITTNTQIHARLIELSHTEKTPCKTITLTTTADYFEFKQQVEQAQAKDLQLPFANITFSLQLQYDLEEIDESGNLATELFQFLEQQRQLGQNITLDTSLSTDPHGIPPSFLDDLQEKPQLIIPSCVTHFTARFIQGPNEDTPYTVDFTQAVHLQHFATQGIATNVTVIIGNYKLLNLEIDSLAGTLDLQLLELCPPLDREPTDQDGVDQEWIDSILERFDPAKVLMPTVKAST